ncbi:MAG: hypothetical protein HY815_03795 [Candidatus Riflebacteria bacterium]|nr:hypothetical protein [Candidatus Riflebacteria bacterium]
MARERTAKALAERIDLRYVRDESPLGRRLRLLCWGVCLGGLTWAVVLAITNRFDIYSPGSLFDSHRRVTTACGDCHSLPTRVGDTLATAKLRLLPKDRGPRLTGALDRNCIGCHVDRDHHGDRWIHHDNQTFAPSCASCHVEHESRASLVRVEDRSCTQCHADLKTKTGRAGCERVVESFRDRGHPEFAVLRSRSPDTSRISFGHRFHLTKGLRNLAGFLEIRGFGGANARDSLTCTDCHTPDRTGRRMEPVTYSRHCAACHPLEFDDRFVSSGNPGRAEVAPHADPMIIHGFLVARFNEYVGRHPGVLGGGDAVEEPGARPWRPVRSRRSPDEWVRSQVEKAERGLLLSQRCAVCHHVSLSAPDAGGPGPFAMRVRLAPVGMPTRWFRQARFSHAAHLATRRLECASCHGMASTSSSTADVNLPSIQICFKCHVEKGTAGTRCVECHVYHDRTGRQPSPGARPAPDKPPERSGP